MCEMEVDLLDMLCFSRREQPAAEDSFMIPYYPETRSSTSTVHKVKTMAFSATDTSALYYPPASKILSTRHVAERSTVPLVPGHSKRRPWAYTLRFR